MTSVHARPLFWGVLLAVPTPGICMALIAWVPNLGSASAWEMLGFAAIVSLYSVPISLIASMVLGLPFVLWLRRRGRLDAIHVCLGALAIGAMTMAIFIQILGSSFAFPGMSELLIGAGLGLGAGIAFCFGAGIGIRSTRIAVATRPGST